MIWQGTSSRNTLMEQQTMWCAPQSMPSNGISGIRWERKHKRGYTKEAKTSPGIAEYRDLECDSIYSPKSAERVCMRESESVSPYHKAPYMGMCDFLSRMGVIRSCEYDEAGAETHVVEMPVLKNDRSRGG